MLAKRAVTPRPGCWDVIGGFVEPGETGEQAAKREVQEEIGADVKLERLLGIFSDVYGPEKVPTLNIYYVGRIKKRQDLKPGDDVLSLAWFSLSKLPKRIAFKNNRDALRLLTVAQG